SIGFKYMNEVDPFDGGPHYRCALKNIKPVQQKINGQLVGNKDFIESEAQEVIISLDIPNHDFFGFRTKLMVHSDGQVSIDPKIVKELSLKLPQKISAIPFS